MENQELFSSKWKSDTTEIDLERIFKAVYRRIWAIALIAVLCAALALTCTLYFVTPTYQASAMFYVNNSATIGGISTSLSYADIAASKSLAETYLVILNTRESIEKVIEYAELDYSYEQVRGMISSEGINDTEIFKVFVTSTEPEEAEIIAHAITQVLPSRISEIVEGSSAKIVDRAVVPTARSGPNYIRNTLAGLLIGFLLSVAVVALMECLDNTIKSSEDVENCCTYPILVSVPKMGNSEKTGRKKKNETQPQSFDSVIGSKIGFAATEAYKLLRTKLQYAFSDDKKCHIFMISSAMAGEGKSLISVNLAYSLAQLNKRVLLIDCDMRQPTLAEKIQMSKKDGLAEYLTGYAELKDVIRQGNPDTIGAGVDVIVAGHNPPNPIELLSSEKMARMIEKLRESYAYIILDVPPMGEVSDAMVAAKLADGAILVIRQNYCNRNVFRDTVSQLEFVNAKILGVVNNCVSAPVDRYGYNYKYVRYSKYYRRHSGYAYGQNAAEAKQETR